MVGDGCESPRRHRLCDRAATARADGASVVVHSWAAHDAAQPWGADPGGVDVLLAELGSVGPRLRHIETDLAEPDAPQFVIDFAAAEFGAVDALVANHARSSTGTLEVVTADELDAAWAVNARARRVARPGLRSADMTIPAPTGG